MNHSKKEIIYKKKPSTNVDQEYNNCEYCDKAQTHKSKKEIYRHQCSETNVATRFIAILECYLCIHKSRRSFNLWKHKKGNHEGKSFPCNKCNFKFKKRRYRYD